MENKEERYKFLEYEITSDPDLKDEQFGITPEIRLILQQTHEKVQRRKNSVLKELHSLIEKYPYVPQFKNQLSAMYALQNNITKAREVNHWIQKEHPDYLFGKLNYAKELILNNEFEKVPEILGQLLEIKDLYPERNIFHINEVISFYETAIFYFIKTQNLEAAESRFAILKKISDENIDLSDIEQQIILARLQQGLQMWKKERETAKSVKPVPKKVVEPTDKKPVFYHAEIELLYSTGMNISHEVINKILALPRETLIPDLHKLIYDSIARFDYFINETEWNESTHSFIFHALFLLSELKPEESLKVILDILRQDENFLEFWFADCLTEDMWENIYALGFNQLDILKNFIMEPDNYCYARSEISAAVSQIALHQPEKKDEIIQWYKEVLTFFIAQKENERIIDTSLIGLMMGDLLDIEATALEPLIIDLHNQQLISEGVCGTLTEVLQELHNPVLKGRKKALHSIFPRYDDFLKKWTYYKDDPEDSDEDEDFNYSLPTPFKRTVAKIGRNEPCPCGSGLKYKKCHGK